VSSFVFEALVAILYENDIIPRDFDLKRGLSTCLKYLASSEELWTANGEPSLRELSRLRRANTGLIIVDPLATFINLAAPTGSTESAWKNLQVDAREVFRFLESKGVFPYSDN